MYQGQLKNSLKFMVKYITFVVHALCYQWMYPYMTIFFKILKEYLHDDFFKWKNASSVKLLKK